MRRGKVVAVQLADPGMLTHDPEESGGSAMFAKAAGFADASGPQLDLTPAEIVIRVEVDARFVAE